MSKKEPDNADWQSEVAACYEAIGDAQAAQGDAAAALRSFRDSLTLQERLAKADPRNTQRQDSLRTGLAKVDGLGVLFVRTRDWASALETYRAVLAIAQRLAEAWPDATEWRGNVSVATQQIGDVQAAQGNGAEALKSYRESLAIARRLAAGDPQNAAWQHHLLVAQQRVGNALSAQKDLGAALAAYRESLAAAERLAKLDSSNARWRKELESCIGKIGDLAYDFVLAHDFARALAAADEAIAAGPAMTWIHANRAHALMFLGRVDEARAVYLGHRGEKLDDGKAWEAEVLGDFAEFRKAGLTHPLMDEVEKTFSVRG